MPSLLQYIYLNNSPTPSIVTCFHWTGYSGESAVQMTNGNYETGNRQEQFTVIKSTIGQQDTTGTA
jgi:hypothetical protein